MPSDLERIRELALEETAQGIVEARRLAKKHLPIWINAIEKAIRKGAHDHDSRFFTYESVPGYLWGSRLAWQADSKRLSIDLNELCRVPLEAYTRELNMLLSAPFTVTHCDSLSGYSFFAIDWK